MLTLELEDIVENGNVRVEVGDITSLVTSIEAVGLLQAPTVRKVEGGYELVTGARRLAAIRQIGWDKADFNEIGVDDQSGFIARQWAENHERRDLTPWEASQVAWDLKLEGNKQAEVAELMGVDVTTVSQLQKVAKGTAVGDVSPVEANQLSAKALLEVVDDSVPERTGEVIHAVTEGAHTVKHGIDAVNKEYQLAEFYDKIAKLQQTWHDMGVAVTTTNPVDDLENPNEWGNGFKRLQNVSLIKDLDIKEKVHIGLTCHRVFIHTPSESWQSPTVSHWCVDAKSHTPTKSRTPSVVSPKAEKDLETRATASVGRRKIKDAKDLRIRQVGAWMGTKISAAQRETLANEYAIDGVWRHDHTRMALIVLDLIGDRPTGAEYDWYTKKFKEWCVSTFGDNNLKRDRWMVRFLEGFTHIEQTYNHETNEDINSIVFDAESDEG